MTIIAAAAGTYLIEFFDEETPEKTPIIAWDIEYAESGETEINPITFEQDQIFINSAYWALFPDGKFYNSGKAGKAHSYEEMQESHVKSVRSK